MSGGAPTVENFFLLLATWGVVWTVFGGMTLMIDVQWRG